MPLEVLGGNNKAASFVADPEVEAKGYSEFTGRSEADISAEVNRVRQYLDPVYEKIKASDGDLSNIAELSGTTPDEKSAHMLETQSRLTGVIRALRETKHRLAAAETHRDDIANALDPTDPAGVTTREIEAHIEKLVDERTQSQQRLQRAPKLMKVIDEAMGDSDASEDTFLEHLLRGGESTFDFMPRQGMTTEQKDAARAMGEAFLMRIAPHTIMEDGEYLADKYPGMAAPRPWMAAGTYDTTRYDPFVPRDPGYVPIRYRPPQFIEYVPSVAAMSDAIKYMEETDRTISAAGTAEGARLPESGFGATEQSVDVQDIGHRVTRTTRVLEDAPESMQLINNGMPNGVREQVDRQAFQGIGTAPNLKGLCRYYRAAADTVLTGNNLLVQEITLSYASNAFTKPIEELYSAVEVNMIKTARSMCDLIMVSHEFKALLLSIKGNDQYLWGSPATDWQSVIFGIPVVTIDAHAKGSDATIVTGMGTGAASGDVVAVLLDTSWMRQRPRFGLRMETGFENTDLSQRQRTIIAYLRTCFYHQRPSAAIFAKRQ